MKKFQQFLSVAAFALLSLPAFAGGGLASGTAAATDFKIWIYAFLAICASIYMMIKCAQAWGNKVTWMDVLDSGGKVAVTGGVPALVTFFWGVWS